MYLFVVLDILVILSCSGISLSAPSSSARCTADNSLWFVFDYYPCSKLEDPSDRLGIYKTRRQRCEDPLTDCCLTCENVRQEYLCEDVQNGITLGDGTYECAKLTDVNDRLGIYKNRFSICQQQTTKCCVTCKNIGADCEFPNTGVYIADGSYPCARLLDPRDTLGIYKNRQKICDDKLTKCCITCETVRQELTGNTTSDIRTTPASPSTTHETITGGTSSNQACERNVWVAGGAFDCSYLLDPSNKYGIYQKRREFCTNGAADCCIACRQVLREVTTTESPTKKILSTAKPITTTKASANKDCERHIWLAGGSYDCANLLDTSNKFGIYQKRLKFCDNGVAQCCLTCAEVRKDMQTSSPQAALLIQDRAVADGSGTDVSSKPSGMKNMDENMIIKPSQDIQRTIETQLRESITNSQKQMADVHRAVQESFQNFVRLLAQFRPGAQQFNIRKLKKL